MKSLFLIAETACSHDGSSIRLKKIIRNVINAGFNAIQFQIWKHQNIIDPNHPEIQKLKKVEISYKDWMKIVKFTRKISNIEIIACVYDLDAFYFCIKNKIKNFKIHASDIGNKILIKKISEKAKRIDLSVGSATPQEIKKSLKWIGNKCDVWLMYGYQLFPTNPNRLNLSYMKSLNKKFKKNIGYQDHSNFDISGYTIPCAAIGTGVNIVEKHVTDFNSKKRTDGESAIEISDYVKFVEKCKEAKKSIGTRKFNNFNSDERKYRKYSNKIIFFNKNLKKKTIIRESDLIYLRSKKKGIRLDEVKNIIGKKINKNVKKYESVQKKLILKTK